MKLAAYRVYLSIESDGPLVDYSGRLVKTLANVACRETTLFRGVRGMLSPVHVSPLFRPGRREAELGDLVTPKYARREDGGLALETVKLEGEYIVHVGGEEPLVSCIARGLEKLGPRLALRYLGSNIIVEIEKVVEYTGEAWSKSLAGNRFTVYFKGPVKFFNVYAPTRIPKFYPNALDLLIAPYLALRGATTVDYGVLVEAMRLLGIIVETYYSVRTVHPILVPFRDAKEPGIVGKATYIIDDRESRRIPEIEEVLRAAEVYGVGESRANGFGTVVWAPK